MPNMILDALHTVTDVKVLSNPSLVVIDNQVGDIAGRRSGADLHRQRDRAHGQQHGRQHHRLPQHRHHPARGAAGECQRQCRLDIEQEISSVSPATAASLTPTISDRRVKSSISVASGQTVLLAGLISDETDRQRAASRCSTRFPASATPSRSRAAPGPHRADHLHPPAVIRDSVDARIVAEELRSKLNGDQVGGNFPGLHNGPVLHPVKTLGTPVRGNVLVIASIGALAVGLSVAASPDGRGAFGAALALLMLAIAVERHRAISSFPTRCPLAPSCSA